MNIKKIKKITLLMLCILSAILIWFCVQVVSAIIIYSNSTNIYEGMSKELVIDSMGKKSNVLFKHFSGDVWYKKILLGNFWVKISYDKESCINQEVSTVCVSDVERKYFFLKGNDWFLAYDFDNS